MADSRTTLLLLVLAAAAWLTSCQLAGARSKGRENKTKCPQVKAIRNFDLDGWQLVGQWYVVQYYASSEEALSYRCMRAVFSVSLDQPEVSMNFTYVLYVMWQLVGQWYVVQYYASSEEALSYRCMRAVFSVSPDRPEVSMNFTYVFVDDPDAELLQGNITWRIPDPAKPAHWLHEEDSYEGVYNTYVLDSDYESWALLLHCAEKEGSPRYLSSFIMSRRPAAKPNVVSYLRDKLPRYDVDLQYVFAMAQDDCSPGPGPGGGGGVDPRLLAVNMAGAGPARRRHPMQHVH